MVDLPCDQAGLPTALDICFGSGTNQEDLTCVRTLPRYRALVDCLQAER